MLQCVVVFVSYKVKNWVIIFQRMIKVLDNPTNIRIDLIIILVYLYLEIKDGYIMKLDVKCIEVTHV